MNRIVIAVLVVVTAGLAWLVAVRIRQSNEAHAFVPEKTSDALLIKSAHVTRRTMDDAVTFTGSILAHNEVDVFTRIPGRIASVSAQVGDRVHAGEMLAEVEHKEISWQAKSADAAVQAAEAGLKVAQASLEGARVDFNRTKSLFDAHTAPQAQFDGAQLRFQSAQAQLLAAQAQVAQAEAAQGLADQQVENARIETPITGVVTRRTVNVGTNAGPGTAAFTVQDVATLKLESSVQASVFERLKRGMTATITVDALPGEVFTGRVDVLSPALDPQSRRAAIEIAIDNASGRLLPHMFAHASVTIGRLDDALVIPRDAVLEAAGGSIVYRIRSGHAEAVHPELGPDDGSRITVLRGLTDGDEIADSALGNLSDGAPVRISISVSQN